MSLYYALREWVCILVGLWFIVLCFAIMLGLAAGYTRQTKAWLLWPFALLLRKTQRWLHALVKAVGRWLIQKARDW